MNVAQVPGSKITSALAGWPAASAFPVDEACGIVVGKPGRAVGASTSAAGRAARIRPRTGGG